METRYESQEIIELKQLKDGSELKTSLLKMNYCKCGCGQKCSKPQNKFIKGHSMIYYNNTHDNTGENNPAKRIEVRKKISEYHKLHPSVNQPGVKEKIQRAIIKLCKTKEHINKIKKGTRLAMQRPEVKAKMKKNRVYHKKPDILKNHETCYICEKEFIAKKCHNRRFCSKRCAAIYKNFNQKTNDTDIELLFENYLNKNKVVFEKQKIIEGISISDFFIHPNICVYCDGDYWHNKPNVQKRDKWINKQLRKQGFIVKRFLGSDIKKGTISL